MVEIEFEAAVRSLLSAIILQALNDTTQTRQPLVRQDALTWLHSPVCQDYLACLGLGEPNFDTVLKTANIRTKLLCRGRRGFSPRTPGGRPVRRTGNPSRPGNPLTGQGKRR